jgi:hypothetical protein
MIGVIATLFTLKRCERPERCDLNLWRLWRLQNYLTSRVALIGTLFGKVKGCEGLWRAVKGWNLGLIHTLNLLSSVENVFALHTFSKLQESRALASMSTVVLAWNVTFILPAHCLELVLHPTTLSTTSLSWPPKNTCNASLRSIPSGWPSLDPCSFQFVIEKRTLATG